MKRSWTAYTLAFVGLLLLVALVWWLRITVLRTVETDSAEAPSALMALMLFALPGIHCVAMFAATPAWRRRALYVRRLPWSAPAAAVFLVVLLMGPAVLLGAVVSVAEEIVGVETDAPDSRGRIAPSPTKAIRPREGSADRTCSWSSADKHRRSATSPE